MGFPRQRKPVTVIVQDGEAEDIAYYRALIQRFMDGREDTQNLNHQAFRIYPRAVND